MKDADETSLESLFHAARGLPGDQRAVFLSAHCDDPAVREEVEQLLHCGDGPTVLDQLSGLRPPVIPRYRIIEVLGEGGFGVVYRAEQQEPVRRLVAIKVARWSSVRDRRLERFGQEIQILARLDHPGIAKLYETGTTADGRPFVVMECVAGDPITAYCHTRRLSVRRRIELVASVCDAVQHAHQQGIIHRDLKPSNVLVAEVDGRPAPKVIDFGVAKWSGSAADPRLTLDGELVGTPAYMSPEQASHAPADARTDVFSLAAILYELLTSLPPLNALCRHDATLSDLLAQASRGQFLLASAAAARQKAEPNEPVARPVDLRGDLDAVLEKALQCNPADRYASVSEFAAELRRHLADEPVLARRQTTRTALRRIVRRHRLAVAVSAATLATLLIGIAGTLTGLVHARRESASARAQCDLLVEILTRADPLARGTNATIRELLDAASVRLSDSARVVTPELAAKTRAVLGCSYAGLGLYDEAQRELRAAIDISADDDVLPPLQRASVLREYADALRQREVWDECEHALAQAFALVPGESIQEGIERAALLRSRSHLRAAQQQLDAALLDSAAALKDVVRLRDCPITLRLHCQTWHGALLRTRERFEESEAVIREALATATASVGEEHPQTAMILTDLADTLLFSGRPTQAVESARRALDIRQAALGPSHPHTINSMVTLAACSAEVGSFDQASRLRQLALDFRTGSSGPDSERVAIVHYLAGLEALDRGDHEGAIRELSVRVDRLESHSGSAPLSLATTRAAYAAALILAGDIDRATAQLELIRHTWPRTLLNPSVSLLTEACSTAMTAQGATSARDHAAQLVSLAQSTPMLPSRQRLILRLLQGLTHPQRD